MLKNTLSFICIGCNVMIFSQNLQWTVEHPVSKKSMVLGEKGTVQEVLQREGELPDPNYGENESKYQWIEEKDWVFKSVFNIEARQMEHDFIEIEFPSLDTYATIYLNDSLIAQTANAFHPHRFQIKKYLLTGENHMEIRFKSPVNYHLEAYERRDTKLPAPNDAGRIAVASMSRKPQYQFGWDWALRLNTIGLWKPAKIHVYNENRIVQAKIETQALDYNNDADLNLSLYLSEASGNKYRLTSTFFGEFRELEIQDKRIQLQVRLINPVLWWPSGYGKQFLYTDTLRLYTDSGELIEEKTVRFGVRTSTLIQEKDQWGTSFYFKINGQALFCKGANFIPQEVVPSKVTDQSTRYLVEQMKESNFNMVRVWGGGYYQDEVFYEACDELGILVWQDLMFACAMYPGDDAFLALVKEELKSVVPRLASHPSVVYFNGNNEVDVAWKNWGFQARYLIGPAMQRKMEDDYKRLFKELAPMTIREHSNLPYVHTSPLSNWGKDENFNHGTMHYWGVWHGKDPIEDFGLKAGRFNAEYGFQSFPEFSTLKSFAEEKDWHLSSSVMKQHQKSYVGNGMIKKQTEILFGKAKTFREFVYLSQLTQAKAIGIAIAGHRTETPRCMGTLYWQFNDCWPAPTWSGIDYYNNWKALQYQVKADYEDLGIVEQTKKIGEERYMLVTNLPDSFLTSVDYGIYNLKGELLLSKQTEISVKGPKIQEVCLESQSQSFKNQNYVLRFNWKDALGANKTRTFFHESNHFHKAAKEDVKLELTAVDPSKKTALIKLTNKQFLASCWIFSSKQGIRFDRNFEHLLPGEHFIRIHFDQLPKQEDFELMWR